MSAAGGSARNHRQPVSRLSLSSLSVLAISVLLLSIIASADAAAAAPSHAPPRITPEGPTVSLSVYAGDGENVLNWAFVPSDQVSRHYGSITYLVFRSSFATGTFSQLPARVGKSTSLTDPVSVPGLYRYYVEAKQGNKLIARSEVATNDLVDMSRLVGALGAKLQAANGDIVLDIPPAAFAQPTPVRVIEVEQAPPVTGAIKVAPYFRFEPDGAVLAVPAAATIRYAVPVSHFQVAATLKANTAMVSYDPAARLWRKELSTPDGSQTFTGYLSHFSYWTGEAVQPHGVPATVANYCQAVCHNLVVSAGNRTPVISTDKSVCYNCHGNDSASKGPAGAQGPNIQAQLFDEPDQAPFTTATASRHPTPEGKLACASCHNQHRNPARYYKLLRAKKPDGSYVEPSRDTSTVGSSYCWACHGTAANPSVEANDPGYYGRTGGDKKTYMSGSGHDSLSAPTASQIKCLACHSPHAAANTALVATQVAGHAVTGNNNTLCLDACHTAATRTYTGGALYEQTKHASVATSTKARVTHSDSESAPGSCQNCHEPHGTANPDYLRASGNALCTGCHDSAETTKPANYSYRGGTAFSQTPHGTAGRFIYDTIRPDGSDFEAWESNVLPTPSSPGTPMSGVKKSAMLSRDSLRATTSLATAEGGGDYQMYRFRLDHSAADMQALTADWTGYGEASHPPYRRPITLTGSTGGPLTDYQVPVMIDTASLVAARKMQSSGDDIRFTNESGTLLPYWIESGMNTASTRIWVKVDSIPNGSLPSPNNRTTIWMTYGDPEAAGASSGTATFQFFDDFSGGSLGASWTKTTVPTGTVTVGSGLCVLDTSASQGYALITRTLPTPYKAEARVSVSNVYDGTNSNRIRGLNSGTPFDAGLFDDGSHASVQAYFNGWTGAAIPLNQYLRWRATHTGSSNAWGVYTDAGSQVYANTYAGASNDVGFSVGDAGGTMYGRLSIDWVFTRKYAAAEPVAASPGSEQGSYPTSLYVWNYTLNAGSGGWEAVGSGQMSADTTVKWIKSSAAAYVGPSNYLYMMAKARHIADSTPISGATPLLSDVSGAVATVKWTTHGSATSYVDYGPTSAYGTTVGSDSMVADHSVTIALGGAGPYHYRIRSTDANGVQYVSPDFVFDPPPPALTLTPDYGTESPPNVTLSWTAPPEPARGPFSYKVKVTGAGGYSYSSNWLGSTSLVLNLNFDSYTWRVLAKDKDGVISGWSPEDSFVVYYVEPPYSCPFLYTWEGNTFAFESDLGGAGRLGSTNASGYRKPFPHDYYVLDKMPETTAGALGFRLVEESHEVDYLDTLKLYALDVPAGKDVYAEKSRMGDTYRGLASVLHTADADAAHPVSVTESAGGADVSAKVHASDGEYLVLNQDRNNFTYQSIELNLGNLSAAPQIKLILDARSMMPNTPAGNALTKNFGPRTKLEVPDVFGNWSAVPSSAAVLPVPAEYKRPFIFDVTRAFTGDDYRVRLTFLYKTYIDSIRLDTTRDESVTISEVPLTSADLRFHGFDDRTSTDELHDFAYGEPNDEHYYFPGDYTKFGEVGSLLGSTDDKFVIMGGGDEIDLKFAVPRAAPEGHTRRYLAYTVSYYKDPNTDITKTVDPLPFAAMSNFPYPDTEHYPDDAEHQAYLAEWNTRHSDGDLGQPPQGQMAIAAGVEAVTADLQTYASYGLTDWAEGGTSAILAAEGETEGPGAEQNRSLNTNYIALEVNYLLGGGPSGLCANCHVPHGEREDDGTLVGKLLASAEEKLCLGGGGGACHSSSANSVLGVNIYDRLTAGGSISARHDVRRVDQQQSGGKVACSNCHNVHRDTGRAKYSDPDDKANGVVPHLAKYVGAGGEVYMLAGAQHDGVLPVISNRFVELPTGALAPRLTWTTDEPATSWIDWGTSVAYEWGSYGNGSLVTAHGVQMPGLSYGVTYHYRIRSADALGNERSTGDYTYTPVDPPSPPNLIDQGNIAGEGSAYAALQWNAVSCPDTDPAQYLVQVSTAGDFSSIIAQSPWQPATTWGVTLGTGSWYYWRVRARDSVHTDANSNWSTPDSFYAEYVPPEYSCPFLFTWDGTGYKLESDMYGAGRLGSTNASGYRKPFPHDYYLLRNAPQMKDGALSFRLVEEFAEAQYLDTLRLYALDVPAGKDVYAEKSRVGGTFAGLDAVVHTVESPTRAVGAVDVSSGANVSAKLAASDGDYLVLNQDRNDFNYRTVELDLGDLSAAPQVKLILDARTMVPNTPEGNARTTQFGARTKLEVPDASGNWSLVPSSRAALPVPGEFRRPFIFDVTPAFVTDDYRIRLTFLYKTYIDSIRLDASRDESVTMTEVPLTSADLRFHGVDARTSEDELFEFSYGPPNDTHYYFPGGYTKFGEASPLLEAFDDKFAIFGGGDEFDLTFAEPAPVPAGAARRYLVYVAGYYKDENTDIAKTVEPLPFDAMSNFPYPDTESYPNDAEHQAYLAEWNTRVWGGEGSSGAQGQSLQTAPLAAFATSGQSQEPVSHYSVNTDLAQVTVKENGQTTNYAPALGWQSASATAPTPGAPGSQVPTATLSLASTQDGAYWTTGVSATDRHYNWQLFRFNADPLTRSSLAVTELQMNWRGYGEPTPTYPSRLYIWNFETGAWEQKVSQDVAAPATFSFKVEYDNRAFCVKCHDGAPPAGVVLPGGLRNVAATWSAGDKHGDVAGGGFGGSLKSPYGRGQTALSCDRCHDSHGSTNIYHFKEQVNGGAVTVPAGGDTTSLCVSCHDGGVNSFHAQCIGCHMGDGGYHSWPRTDFTGNDCLSCHRHGSAWAHPDMGCHGCGDPLGYGGASF